jgi:hypothetical protein
MKKMCKLPAHLLGLALSLIAAASAHANEKGNGGDPVLLRAGLIREYIDTSLRQDLQDYFKTLNLLTVDDLSARIALQSMLDRDAASDLQKSRYVIKESCAYIGGQAAAGAKANELGGDICFSPKRLAELGSTKAEVVGLAAHEHAHHFGYSDSSYAIYKAVFRTLQLKSPEWGESLSGSPANATGRFPVEYTLRCGPNQTLTTLRLSRNLESVLSCSAKVPDGYDAQSVLSLTDSLSVAIGPNTYNAELYKIGFPGVAISSDHCNDLNSVSLVLADPAAGTYYYVNIDRNRKSVEVEAANTSPVCYGLTR